MREGQDCEKPKSDSAGDTILMAALGFMIVTMIVTLFL